MAQKNVEYVLVLKDKFTKNLKGANKQASTFGKSMNAVSGTIKSLAPALGALGVALVFKKAISVAMDFEKSMSDVKAITNANNEEFTKLSDKAEELGKSTAFSAKEAAEGMKFLGMAGFKTGNILKAIPGVLDLAAAGSLGLGQAADIASNVLTQFGIKAENLGRVNDVIAKTASNSNTSVEQMAEGLKYTGTTSAILNQSIEETSSAIGVLANAGLQGSLGGTALNFSLLTMANSASPASKKLKALGVNVNDANGKFIGINNVIKQFEEKNITARKAIELFGARGGRAIGTLVKAGSKQLIDFTQSLEDAEGTAKRMALIKLDNLAGDFTMLKSAAQGLAITFGKRMTPAMRNTVKASTRLTTVLDKMLKQPIEKKIRKESSEATILVGKLRNVNLKENDRLELIKKLTQISPTLTKGIDAENISMLKLTDNLRKYNRLQAKRIVLAGLEKDEQKLLADEGRRYAKIEKLLSGEGLVQGTTGFYKLREAAIKIGNKDYVNSMTAFISAVESSNVKLAESTSKNLPFTSQDEAAKIISQLKKINQESGKQIDIKSRINRINTQLGGENAIQSNTMSISGELDDKTKRLESTITSRSPKVVNITINKVIETQEINTQNITESIPQIKRLMGDVLMDIINDSQLTSKAS